MYLIRPLWAESRLNDAVSRRTIIVPKQYTYLIRVRPQWAESPRSGPVVSRNLLFQNNTYVPDQSMFIQVTDEDDGASVGRIPSEWSSGKQKLIALTQYLCTKQRFEVCLCSIVFVRPNRIVLLRFWPGGGSREAGYQEESVEDHQDRFPVSSLC